MLLIKNARIYTMADVVLEKGDILIENGKIKEVGENIEADNAEVYDASGLTAIPGIVECHTHIGLMNPENETLNSSDVTETTSAVTPSMNVIYGVDITVKDFKFAYENGVTTAGIIPGSANVINGLGLAAKTYGNNIFDMCIKNPIGFKVAFGENPKGAHGSKGRAPASRMGVAPLVREILYNGRKYMEEKERALKNNEEFETDEKLEAVIPVLKREIPMRIHCTHNDMATAIDICKEFNTKFTLEHAWGSDDYIDEIVESGCGIVYGPIGGKKTFFESRITDIATVKILDEKGVLVALTTDSPILSISTLLNMAEEAVRQGTPYERALRMITINAAEILGVEDRTGSIEVGKDADIALFNGIPAFDMSANIVCTICDGEIIFKK